MTKLLLLFTKLLLFNTTRAHRYWARAHAPDPQARGPLSLWTEV